MSHQDALLDNIMSVMEAAFDPAFGEAWNRRQVADALTMPSTHALVFDEEGNLISHQALKPVSNNAAGFVMTKAAPGEEELLLIGVVPKFRRSGLGERMLEYLINTSSERGVERIFLEMRRGNPAIHLYSKLGFQPIGERLNYYRLADGQRADAITFCRAL